LPAAIAAVAVTPEKIAPRKDISSSEIFVSGDRGSYRSAERLALVKKRFRRAMTLGIPRT
jgi:hypothetical protein